MKTSWSTLIIFFSLIAKNNSFSKCLFLTLADLVRRIIPILFLISGLI